MSAFSDEARAAAVDAQLEALLPQGAEDTLQRLEHSASCSQERAERAWRALLGGVAAHFAGSADEAADAAADAALAALPAPPSTPEARLSECANQHARAAAHVSDARGALAVARWVAQLTTSAEKADALALSGRLVGAAACAAAAEPAARALSCRAAAPSCVPPLLEAHAKRCAALRRALDDALAGRVRLTLEESRDAGGAACVDGDEPLSELWGALHALGAADAAAATLGARATQELLAPLLCAVHPLVLTVSSTQLSWRARALETPPDDTIDPFHAAAAALRFLCCDVLAVRDAAPEARAALGSALWPGLGAAAVQHVRARLGAAASPEDPAWDAAMAGAAMLDRAARELGLAAQAGEEPVTAALAASRADADALVRGEWLARARASVLGLGKGALCVGGAWRDDAADMRLGCKVHARDVEPGLVHFPPCSVSATSLALAALLREHADAALRGPPATRARRLRAAADAADLLRACGPCVHGAELEAVPGAAMLFRNDSHFVAYRLMGAAAACGASQLAGMAAALCATGDAWLAAAVEAAAADSAAVLHVPDGFHNASAPPQRVALERALAGALHAVQRFAALAEDTLPRATASVSSSAVLSALGEAVVQHVLDVRDVSVDDARVLCEVLDTACTAAALPLDARLRGSDAPGWRRLAAVRRVLDASLAEITAAAEGGQLGALSAAELGALVRAVFSDTHARADALRRISAAPI